MDSYSFVDIDTAIKELENIKNSGRNIVVCMINFDKKSSKKIIATYDESCKIIRNGVTIAHNRDEYISHLEVFSILQNDIKNIKPKGIMHDILIGSY